MAAIRFSRSVLGAAALAALAGCGGGGGSSADTSIFYDPTSLLANPRNCIPGNDVIGAWKIVANSATLAPGSAGLTFFSFNQPSINTYGLVVFRGRAKSPTGAAASAASGASGAGGAGGSSATQPQRGIYTAAMCPTSTKLYIVADTANVAVPAPNNTSATFNEFPSIPRIDMSSGLVATRGQTTPVWTYTDPLTGTDTRAGTSGVYVTLPGGLATGINLLGAVADFPYMQVPNASTTGVKFDQFPGSPSVTGNRYLVTKANYTDGSGKTGIYFRDLDTANSPVQVIADSSTQIPGAAAGTLFGSTAPPSAANSKVVFTGLDNEASPTAGGIYVAPIASLPTLTPVVQIGTTPVPDRNGQPLPAIAPSATPPVFTLVGEGLSFDGRYVAFWGAWNTGALDAQGNGSGMHGVTLTCPTDGSAQLQAACQSGATDNGNGQWQTTRYVPDNQGLFVVDTSSGKIWMVADAGTGSSAQFQDFEFWTFSGAPTSTGSSSGSGSGSGGSSSGSGGSGSGSGGSSTGSGGSSSSGPADAEPPRWRASAFAAVDGNHGVVFKGSLNPAYIASAPASGIYGVSFDGHSVGALFKVVALGDSMATLDPAAPAGSSVTAVSLEREALRGGWLALSAASANAANESWAGIYVTDLPNGFKTDGATPLPNLVLGR